MNEKLIRLPQVMELTGLARSTVWLWVKEGRLPKPMKLSHRVTVWKESDILKFIRDAITSVDTAEIENNLTVGKRAATSQKVPKKIPNKAEVMR
jgi:prophage regulatory protein